MCCRRNCRCRTCSRTCNSNNTSCNFQQRNSSSCNCMQNTYSNNCSQNNNVFPKNFLYGHAYTPNQYMNNTFTPEVGLENGTIFPELVSPYSPGQSIDFIEYLRSGGM